MDNECLAMVEKYIRSEQINIQLVPPHNQRVNTAERAIATFKEHFIAALTTVDMHCPLNYGMNFSRKWNYLNLGCAFRFLFRFLPVLIFRKSGYSAEFPKFRGTHVGIISFQGKIYLVRNSGLRNFGLNSGGILCHV
jgi:hypothetical protein